EVREILAAGLVHAAARMASTQIPRIEIVALVGQRRRVFADLHIGIAAQAALLAAVWHERRHVDAAGFAGVTAGAMRVIDVAAGAAEAAAQRQRIQPIQPRRRRIEHQILRGTRVEIAAGVRQGLEQADAFGTERHSYFCERSCSLISVDISRFVGFMTWLWSKAAIHGRIFQRSGLKRRQASSIQAREMPRLLPPSPPYAPARRRGGGVPDRAAPDRAPRPTHLHSASPVRCRSLAAAGARGSDPPRD